MKRLNLAQAQLTLRGISPTRKHLYFYLLLFLTTVVVHNIWRSLNASSTPQTVEQTGNLHEMADTAKRMTP